MEKAGHQRISTAALDNCRRLGMVVSAAMLAQIIVAFTPTAASAFDIRGLIGTATGKRARSKRARAASQDAVVVTLRLPAFRFLHFSL